LWARKGVLLRAERSISASRNSSRIAPHWHPAVECVTVIAGTFHLGMGEAVDQSKAKALPASSFVSMAPKMPHFAWAEGETIVQLNGEEPWGITYLKPVDDPRQMEKSENYSGFHSNVWHTSMRSACPPRKTEVESVHQLGNCSSGQLHS
jgi:hypothetical protein